MKLYAALLCSLIASQAFAQEKLTANTLKLSPGQKPAAATIEDMRWYAGRWTGDGLGGFNEEVWSTPRDGGMMGMYRLIKNGKVVFYELLSLIEDQGSLVLRLKHFHADLRGWEERDEVQSFGLVAKRDGRFYFEGMTFEPVGQDRLNVYLAIDDRKTGSVHEEKFSYVRTPAESAGDAR